MPRVLLSAEQKSINKKLSNKKYRDTHKNENKEYRKSPEGLKALMLAKWKFRGITFGEMTPSMYYDVIYLPATICMSCEKTFDKNVRNDRRCNDHNNRLTEDDPLYLCNVRGVICNECNVMDMWKKRLTPDSIYNQYLTKQPLTNTLINTNENISIKA